MVCCSVAAWRMARRNVSVTGVGCALLSLAVDGVTTCGLPRRSLVCVMPSSRWINTLKSTARGCAHTHIRLTPGMGRTASAGRTQPKIPAVHKVFAEVRCYPTGAVRCVRDISRLWKGTTPLDRRALWWKRAIEAGCLSPVGAYPCARGVHPIRTLPLWSPANACW